MERIRFAINEALENLKDVYKERGCDYDTIVQYIDSEKKVILSRIENIIKDIKELQNVEIETLLKRIENDEVDIKNISEIEIEDRGNFAIGVMECVKDEIKNIENRVATIWTRRETPLNIMQGASFPIDDILLAVKKIIDDCKAKIESAFKENNMNFKNRVVGLIQGENQPQKTNAEAFRDDQRVSISLEKQNDNALYVQKSVYRNGSEEKRELPDDLLQ